MPKAVNELQLVVVVHFGSSKKVALKLLHLFKTPINFRVVTVLHQRYDVIIPKRVLKQKKTYTFPM